jgi:hypothetical protein
MKVVNSEIHIYYETYIQGLAVLNNSLLIQPLQHSLLMWSIFIDTVFDRLFKDCFASVNRSASDLTIEEYEKNLNEILKIDYGTSNTLMRGRVKNLLQIAAQLRYGKRRVVFGINYVSLDHQIGLFVLMQ